MRAAPFSTRFSTTSQRRRQQPQGLEQAIADEEADEHDEVDRPHGLHDRHRREAPDGHDVDHRGRDQDHGEHAVRRLPQLVGAPQALAQHREPDDEEHEDQGDGSQPHRPRHAVPGEQDADDVRAREDEQHWVEGDQEQRPDADLAMELEQGVLAEGRRRTLGPRHQRELEGHEREPDVAEGVGERDGEAGGVGPGDEDRPDHERQQDDEGVEAEPEDAPYDEPHIVAPLDDFKNVRYDK